MGKLDDVLAGINKKLYQEYKDYGIPAEDRLFDQLDVDTTQQAIADATKARRTLGQVDDRNASRFGVTKNSAQQGNSERRTLLSTRSAVADAGNNAIIDDDARELGTLQTLMNQGASLRNAAQGGLGVAAANEQAKESAYNQAKQQYKSNATGAVGSLLGAGAAFLI
jgi:hypothetical protein